MTHGSTRNQYVRWIIESISKFLDRRKNVALLTRLRENSVIQEMVMMATKIINVKDLVLTYADGTKAVQGISFSVKEGEFFGFLGPNGASKSTTIKILTTLLRKSE